MTRAANVPAAFALRNLDAKGKPVETTRFRSPTAAMYKAIELRTGSRATTRGPKPTGARGDGQVREVVGLDAAGDAWTIESAPLTAGNMTGYVLVKLLVTKVPAKAPVRAKGRAGHLTLVK